MDFVVTLLNAASLGLLVSAVMCRLSRTYKFYFKSSMLYLTYFITSLGRLLLGVCNVFTNGKFEVSGFFTVDIESFRCPCPTASSTCMSLGK